MSQSYSTGTVLAAACVGIAVTAYVMKPVTIVAAPIPVVKTMPAPAPVVDYDKLAKAVVAATPKPAPIVKVPDPKPAPVSYVVAVPSRCVCSH